MCVARTTNCLASIPFALNHQCVLHSPVTMNSSSGIALKTFELSNDFVELDPATDTIFAYDEAEQARIRNEAPWKKE